MNEEGCFIGEDDKGIEVGLTEESFNEGNIDFHISGVKSLKTGKNVLYNLAGQRVGSSYKGIVIKDGKKAVLK